jgi:GMP synthase (glutamine-hydrolysing)
MSENVIVVNTHPFDNPQFVHPLSDLIKSTGLQPIVVDGYGSGNPLGDNPSHILLTGVPAGADYSLSQPKTQEIVSKAFAWLRECECPVLGICYGHQILAHIFGGQVAPLEGLVRDTHCQLEWQVDPFSGIFSEFNRLLVFIEHRDYVSKVPSEFRILCKIGQVPYIVYHPKRHIYGLQFVPEYSDQSCKQIVRRFVKI